MSEVLCQKLSVDGIIDDETLVSWLEEQARNWKLNYLLAHADDGVIWGRFDEGKLTTAEKVFHKPEFKVDFPSLRLLTLQQCRIFGQDGEVLLWRTGETLLARLIQDNPDTNKFSERQILWGNHGEKRDNFSLLWDGSQGLKHAVPFTDIALDKHHKLINPVRLIVHHYITYDNDGLARIYLSRLVNLTTRINNHESETH
ncbi:TIGR03984 family CRISPR-associated protein [Phormidium sp. LEGE 05292]|uniref:type III-D CRISPR-associated protein Csx19 n=1 Tax=[Phormidium] sp. LEGE 05292 TaxID=767427 RepID=UPI00187F22D0|nr:CRISPR-associated protein Csx19 [Phormidium sp. LEGE 05292]MBE9227481.1 TIGR03984 family CRISPR-associated protein [Phormidium sp. LEGE 05292]